MKIPPPEERLCRNHGRPISVSGWKSGHRTSGCAKCTNERGRSPEKQAEREAKWRKEFIGCKSHPNRRCNLSAYKRLNAKLCGSCHLRRADRTLRDSVFRCHKKANERYRKSEHGKEQGYWKQVSRRKYNRIQENKI